MVFSGPGHRSVGSTVEDRVPPRVSGIDGSGGTREVHRDAPRRRLRHRARATGGLPRVLRPHVLPEGVRRARPEADDRPGQPGVQRATRARCAGCTSSIPPAAETKLVRCTRGAILDIIVDLRPESPTYLEHVEVELTADNHRALYVPERFAHGYQVLEDDTETSYQVGEFYTPETEGGLRHDDPRLGLDVAAAGHRDVAEGRGLAAARRGRAGAEAADERLRRSPTGWRRDDHRRQRVEGSARRDRAARSRSAWSAPASWARASPTRSRTACPACGWRRSTTARRERAEDVYRYSGLDDVVRVDTQAAFDAADRRRPRGGRRGPDADLPVAAHRRHRRRDRLGRVRRPRVHRGVRPRQARRDDERRGRRDDRPDPADLRQARTA